MTKEELQSKIDEAKVHNDKFESLIPSIVKHNEYLEDWLSTIQEDMDNIPERIREIIAHNIKDLNLPDLASESYDETREEEVERYQNNRLMTIIQCKNFLQVYSLYKSVGYVERNTVIVGANGSGKTTLANKLIKTLNIEDGIVIPAQKLLVVPTFENIPTLKSEKAPFEAYQNKILDDKRTFSAKNRDDFPYEMTKEYGSEYRNVLALLIAERNARRNEIIEGKEDGTIFNRLEFKTTIDTVIEIWNELIPHRMMYLDPDCNLMIKFKGEDGKEQTYEAFRMSDGERIILYLVGRIMKAPQNGLIIVDEPEVFLHRTVVDKLWDRLEMERKDCTFIYMTHDLQFATSRVGVKSWIKSYKQPSSWDIQIINENEIPEQLLMELLGSCKQVLFCEGTSTTSLDKKVFDVLFPNFIIYPVETCKEVISYTKAYNAIPATNTKAYGLVDSDFRTAEEINDLKANNIYSYHVAEIENVFLTELFLQSFMDYHHWSGDVEKIKDVVITKLDEDKEAQVSNYVSAKIDYYYRKNHLAKGNSKAEVESKIKEFNDEIKIDDWYAERMREIELYISRKNYIKVISVYNNKGLRSIIEKELGIKHYFEKALEYLKIAQKEVIDDLKKLFPSELYAV